jgi:hypothetical protein
MIQSIFSSPKGPRATFARFEPDTRPPIWGTHRAAMTQQVTPDHIPLYLRAFPHRRPFWVIYGPDNIDMPGVHLARLFFGAGPFEPTNFVVSAPDLEHLRSKMWPYAIRAERRKGDCVSVLELYL